MGFWVTCGWKWLPGHRFAMENELIARSSGLLGDLGLEVAPRVPGHSFGIENGRSGGLLRDLGLEMAPRTLFRYGKLTVWELW